MVFGGLLGFYPDRALASLLVNDMPAEKNDKDDLLNELCKVAEFLEKGFWFF